MEFLNPLFLFSIKFDQEDLFILVSERLSYVTDFTLKQPYTFKKYILITYKCIDISR